MLQKSKSLKGSSIVISEDFPRDIMQKRRHLIKFAKQVNIIKYITVKYTFLSPDDVGP